MSAPTGGPPAPPRIYLSPPHMSGREQVYVNEAFATNWVAPVGPHVTHLSRSLPMPWARAMLPPFHRARLRCIWR